MKIFVIFCIFFSAYSVNVFSQSEDETEYWHTPDIYPSYPDGMPNFYEYIRKNFKCTPNKANYRGKLLVQFVIDSKGFVRPGSVKPQKEISEMCKEKLINVLEKSPKWNPGHVTKLNKDVAVNMMLPINFD